MMSAEGYINFWSKKHPGKNYSAVFGDSCCMPEFKLNLIGKESKLVLAYLNLKKIIQQREDG